MPQDQWQFLNLIADYAFLVFGCLAMVVAVYRRRRRGRWNRPLVLLAVMAMGMFAVSRLGARLFHLP